MYSVVRYTVIRILAQHTTYTWKLFRTLTLITNWPNTNWPITDWLVTSWPNTNWPITSSPEQFPSSRKLSHLHIVGNNVDRALQPPRQLNSFFLGHPSQRVSCYFADPLVPTCHLQCIWNSKLSTRIVIAAGDCTMAHTFSSMVYNV